MANRKTALKREKREAARRAAMEARASAAQQGPFIRPTAVPEFFPLDAGAEEADPSLSPTGTDDVE